MATVYSQDQAQPAARTRLSPKLERWVPILFLLPALVALLLFRLLPAGYTLVQSFQHNGQWVGLENYIFLFTSNSVIDSLRVTLLFNVVINPLQVTLALAIAVLLSERLFAVGLWRLMVFMPIAVPLSVTAIVWGVAFRPDDGIINAILNALSLPSLRWLTSPEQALVSIMIMASWAGVGYWTVFLIAGLKDIPEDLKESAALDGAGYWQTFFNIVLPLMRRPIAFVLVADTVANFLLFAPVQILTSGGPSNSTNLFMFEIYQNAFTFADYGLAYAEMVILIIVMLLIVSIQFYLLQRLQAEGG